MKKGMTFEESCRVRRIPPLSAEETLEYYVSGTIPERFADGAETRRRSILQHYVPETDNDVLGILRGGNKL